MPKWYGESMAKRQKTTLVLWYATAFLVGGGLVLPLHAEASELKEPPREVSPAGTDKVEPGNDGTVSKETEPREPRHDGRDLRQRPPGMSGGGAGQPFGPSSGPAGFGGPNPSGGPDGRGGMMPNPEERQRARELIRESMPSVQSILERTPDRLDRLKIFMAFGLRHVRALDRARLAGEDELRAATEAIAADNKLVAELLAGDLDSPAGVEKFTVAMRQRIEPAFDAWLAERQTRIATLRAMLAQEEERLKEDEQTKAEKIDTQVRQFVELARYAKEHWDEKVEVWPRGGMPGGGPRGERPEGGPPR